MAAGEALLGVIAGIVVVGGIGVFLALMALVKSPGRGSQ